MSEKDVSLLEKKIQGRLKIDQFYSMLVKPLGPAIASIPYLVSDFTMHINQYASLIT